MSDYISRGIENVIQKGLSNYRFTKNKAELFYFGRFYQDTEKFILSDVECAEYFLNCIKSGGYLLNDVNPLNTLLKLYSKIKSPYSDYLKMKPLFIETLEYIENNISEVMNVEFRDLKEYGEDLGCYYDYGPYCLLVNAMSMIRDRALAGYVRSMALHLKKFPDITDLWGGNYLLVSNVKLDGVEPFFGDIKADHSEFTMAAFAKLSNGKWRVTFNDLGPENNFIYMQAAYKYVAELLAYSLSAEVELVTWLDD
ncbi:hypothetical protein [Psychromonas sp.]|uniref:hypothetical protein n=1 Tax=Psychromonas sp. TaxID=1884585 RepID=UPI0035642CEF